MQKLFIVTCLILIGAVAYYASTMNIDINQKLSDLLNIKIDDNLKEDKVEEDSSIGKYEIYTDEGIYFASFPSDTSSRIISQIPNVRDGELKYSIGDLADEGTLFAINSSYFTPEYKHVGLLVDKGDVQSKLSLKNPQATHVLELGTEMNIHTIEEFNNYPNDYITEDHSLIQVGPLVIENNVVQTEYIQNSLNGNSEHLRSLIGYTDSGEIFAIATWKKYSLENLAEKILELESLQKYNITVINLDGGSSVSFVSFEEERFEFGSEKKNPFYIGLF